MINQREKELSGYNPNLTGKGVRIAHLEYYASTIFPSINVSNKLNITCGDSTGVFGRDVPDDNHPFQTAAVIRDMLPEAVIDYFPQNDYGLQAAIDGKYDLLSFSGRQCMADNDLEKKLAEKTFICVSCGNEGATGEGGGFIDVPARQEWWNAIGAVHLEDNGEIGMAIYSSYGYDMVKTVGFANIQYREGSVKVPGTSFACPWNIALLGQFTQAFYERFKTKPLPKEYLHFISKHCVDVCEGTLKDGAGRLVLPDLSAYDFGILFKEGLSTANVNGVTKTLEAPAKIFKTGDVIPAALAGRTYVPAAALRHIGMSVNYHTDVNGTIIMK